VLHVGVGYFYYNWPQLLPDFDQSKLGWAKNYYANMFPNIAGISNAPEVAFRGYRSNVAQ
jgi:hypothetical protein